MRDLISTILLSIYMYFFAWQPLMDQVNANKALLIRNLVHDDLSQAKIQGYFTAANLQKIQNDVASDLGYPTSEVTVQGTTTPQMRGQFISLTVSVPISLTFIQITPAQGTITESEVAMSEAIE